MLERASPFSLCREFALLSEKIMPLIRDYCEYADATAEAAAADVRRDIPDAV